MNSLSYDRAETWLACFMRPASFDHPCWILLIAAGISSLTGWLIFKVMTDQQKLRRLNEKIIASTLELVLYRHDVTIQIKALAGMLKGIGISAGKILPGAIVAAIPVLLMLMMLGSLFNGRPLKPGESAIVKAYLSPTMSVVDQDVVLKGSGNIAIETPALRVPGANEMNWRFRVTGGSPSPAWLELGIHGKIIRLQVSVGNSRGWRVFDDGLRCCGDAMKRIAGAFGSSDKAVRATVIMYPPREFRLAGIRINWLLAFLLMTVGFTGIFKRFL